MSFANEAIVTEFLDALGTTANAPCQHTPDCERELMDIRFWGCGCCELIRNHWLCNAGTESEQHYCPWHLNNPTFCWRLNPAPQPRPDSGESGASQGERGGAPCSRVLSEARCPSMPEWDDWEGRR